MKPRTTACYADGHFYSPVVDAGDIAAREATIWPAVPQVLGIDFNDASHQRVLDEWYPQYFPDYDYPEELQETAQLSNFYTRNPQFSWLDCRTLFVMLRALRPQRMIEVGSGFSSLLTSDVNRRFLGRSIDFTCIEPYPREFLRRGIDGLTRLLEERVELIPLQAFEELSAGDILFIDSSHVAKTGSDVNYLMFEVLPRLQPGVIVHVHDIFLPNEYPREWVIADNRSWNEQYVLRALLMYSNAFSVLFGCSYAFHRFPGKVMQALAHPRGHGFGGGSLWITRR